MDDLKDWTKVAEHNLHGGLFTQKEQLGQLKSEYDVRSRERRAPKSLNQFAGQDEAEQSEREDEDI